MATSSLSTADKTRQAARQMMRLAADKTKIATARTMKGETHVNQCCAYLRLKHLIMPLLTRTHCCTGWLSLKTAGFVASCSKPFLRVLQEIDIAVVKSTAAQFHVVPKEKHVRSKATMQAEVACSAYSLLLYANISLILPSATLASQCACNM